MHDAMPISKLKNENLKISGKTARRKNEKTSSVSVSLSSLTVASLNSGRITIEPSN